MNKKTRSKNQLPRDGTTQSGQPWLSQQDFLLNTLEQFERPLTAYAMRTLGGDLHAARDIVQHAFLQLCKQKPADIEHKLAPWLYSVCRNRIADQRKSKSYQATPLDDFDAIDFKAVDPAEQLELADVLQLIRQLISGLAESERDVIELWSHGLETIEIANILEKQPGTVRVSLHRAIKRLRQHPKISIWLERATGQVVPPDVEPPDLESASNCTFANDNKT